MALTKVIGAGLGAVTQDGAAVFNEASADVDFRVESNGDANMLFVDGGTDRVGMGTATPASTVHVRSANPNFKLETTSAVASGGTVYNTLRDSTGSDVFLNGFAGLANCYQFATIFANGFMRFLTGNQAEAIRIHSNQVLSASAGIALGVGTANTASNVLDDYEEGTWTPSFNNADSQTGVYTKIGNMVFCTARISTTASGASGAVIGSLPFTTASSNASRGGGVVSYQDEINTLTYALLVEGNGTSIIMRVGSGTRELSASKQAFLSFSYRVA